MNERIQKVCNTKNVYISTFHSLCNEYLRKHGSKIGIEKFKILKDSEQKEILKKIIEEEQLEITPECCINIISRSKNKKQTPEMIKQSKKSDSIGIYRYYSEYQKILKEKNFLDYDDLLVECLNLLNNHKFCVEISSKIKYLLVDEFQDTNDLQYE